LASAALARMDLDWLYVAPGSDFLYFTGLGLGRSERPHGLLVSREGETLLLCPSFEADFLSTRVPVDRLLTWDEHECAYRVMASQLAGSATLALAPQVTFEDYLRICRVLPDVRAVSGMAITRGLRVVKSPSEQRLVETCADIAEQVLDRALEGDLVAGITEREFRDKLIASGLAAGLETARATVLSGPNSAFPHGSTGERCICEGDVVLVDFVTTFEGYHADITRTVVLGFGRSRVLEVRRAVERAFHSALQHLRPGVMADEIDRSARNVLDAEGFGAYFTHRLGHGLGLDVHEDPYLVAGNDGVDAPAYSDPAVHRGVLSAGMVVTIEPAVYLPGEFGLRIEDDVLVTPGGYRLLTRNVEKPLVI